MENSLLEELLLRILSPDNVLRTAAERELEGRCSTTPGFCVALAGYCESVVSNSAQRALALVAFSVLKRALTTSTRYQDVQQVVTRFATHLGDVAVVPGITTAALRQWTSVIVTGVRRIAVLRVTDTASQGSGSAAADVAACLDAVADGICAQLLGVFAQLAAPSHGAGRRVLYCHVHLLQTFFEEPVPQVTQAFCGTLVASCAAPLWDILCHLVAAAAAATVEGGGAKGSDGAVSSSPSSSLAGDEWYMGCALQSIVAQALCTLYEWQFIVSRDGKFPADLKQAFLAAFPALQAAVLAPCAQWAALVSADSSAFGGTTASRLLPALPQASPFIAASLQVTELVVKVLQYGGWYKKCATPALLQGLLNSLEADVRCYVAALSVDDGDGVDGNAANVGPSGTRADAWVAVGGTYSCDDVEAAAAEAAVLVRRHATQRWTLFRDAALLPFLKTGFVDVVGDQCGRRYYQLLHCYALLSPSEVAAWTEEVNTFLREEDEREDGVRWTARDMVAQLYVDSIGILGPLFLHATLEDLHERLFASAQDSVTGVVLENGASASADTPPRVAGGGGGEDALAAFAPLQREASLFFMEAVLRHCGKKLRECGAADFSPLAKHIWTHDVAGPTAHPATTPRAVVLLTAVVHFMSVSASKAKSGASNRVQSSPSSSASGAGAPLDAFMAATVADCAAVLAAFTGTAAASAAPAPSCSLLVAVLLCRFLQSTLPHWQPALLEHHFTSVETSLLALLSPSCALSEEALYATVEQLTDFLRAAQGVVRKRSISSGAPPVSLVPPSLPSSVMACWRRHVSDPSFADVVLPLLSRVVRDGEWGGGARFTARSSGGSSSSAALSSLLQELSWVNKVLSGYAESMAEVCAVPYFLRLLRAIFAHAPDDTANAAATMMLDSLCQLLLCTNESAVIVASSSCLAALLRRCPAAQAVQVHVVAATVEAAVSGAAESDDAAETSAMLIADAPRVAYPFSAVVVAIVLRTLQDARGEASLLEMGQTLVTIMRQSTSFTEAELVQVIHAIVHRLSMVRTDTVRQQLLAPLATLLLLHPAALLRTLVQGGLLTETMSHWLPCVEHFADLSVTFVSCQGMIALLELLVDPSSAAMTAEDGERVAQQSVSCRWRLPVDVAGNASAATADKPKGKRAGVAKKSRKGQAAVVETSLPLFAAVLVAAGRGLVTLLRASLPALRRASRPDSATADAEEEDEAGGEEGDDDGGRRLFQEDSDVDDGEESWEEDVEDFDDDDDDNDDGSGDGDTAVDLSTAPRENAANDLSSKESILAPMGARVCPWMQKYGSEVVSYFTSEETQMLTAFFASAASSSAS